MNYTNQDAQQKADKYQYMFICKTDKSPYSVQCMCYFYEISVHCCPSQISTFFQCEF